MSNPALMSDEELAAKVEGGEIDLLFRSKDELLEILRRISLRERQIAAAAKLEEAIRNMPPIARIDRSVE